MITFPPHLTTILKLLTSVWKTQYHQKFHGSEELTLVNIYQDSCGVSNLVGVSMPIIQHRPDSKIIRSTIP